jgi:DNA-binding transcriptional LysR family regulator
MHFHPFESLITMTLKQIEAFRAVMLAGSITGAAKMLFVSQPAVSRILADLETSIDFKLFARVNRMMVPTDEGRSLYAEIERAFTGLEELKNAAKSIRLCRRGQLRLITVPGIGSNIIAGMVAEFSRINPDVSVSIEIQASQRLFEWVISQQCDVGISALPMDNPALKIRPFARGKAFCILPKGHHLTAKKSILPKDLEGEKFISFRSDSVARRMIDAEFTKAGVERHLQTEARTINVVSALVEAGMGVSVIGPVFDINHMHHDVEIRPFSPAIYTELAFLFPASKPISIIAGKFAEAAESFLSPFFNTQNSSIEAINDAKPNTLEGDSREYSLTE